MTDDSCDAAILTTDHSRDAATTDDIYLVVCRRAVGTIVRRPVSAS